MTSRGCEYIGSLSRSVKLGDGRGSGVSANDLYARIYSSLRSVSDNSSSLSVVVEASSRRRLRPSLSLESCGRRASIHILELRWKAESGDGRRTKKTIRTLRLCGSSAAR